jgi:3-methylfumaryl-CoA hydratase
MSVGLEAWIGRREEANAIISPLQARQMAATLDLDAYGDAREALDDGDVLPPLWHWMGWTPEAPMSGLGVDGHPQRGGFLPPISLERRMWAGGRLTFHAPARIGIPLCRRSEIARISEKQGSTGPMVFVTVRHEITAGAETLISEEQDIVYVGMPDRFTPPPPVPASENAVWREELTIDSALLFRFSAVTFNAHRIHFDLDYAQKVEKYPGLVVHGPLQAIVLMQAARRHRRLAMPRSYQFRGVRPLFHFDSVSLVGLQEAEGRQRLETVQGDGLVCMQADVSW